jgi:hypothetical protein
MPGNWHVRFGGGPYGKGPANCGHLAVRPTQPFTPGAAMHKISLSHKRREERLGPAGQGRF